MTFSRLVIFAMVTMLGALIAFSAVAVGVSQVLRGVGLPNAVAGLVALGLGLVVGVNVWKALDKMFQRNA